jgi:cyclopropane fatty-acyl-phospholipid synthase-like methyltransferase
VKPVAESCIENRGPILTVLRQLLAGRRALLEIGSGTGQHAVYLAPEFPALQWQTSDRAENHPAIHAWLAAEGAANILPPLLLDALQPWPLASRQFDTLFSANTAHIMSWPAVEAMFAGAGEVLREQGLFILYGPFNYRGRYTTEGNARFDAWLRQRDPASGIRDIEALHQCAAEHGLQPYRDFAMPANNRMVVWIKQGR